MDIGQIAYEAYASQHPSAGKLLPWAQLDQNIQTAWRYAAITIHNYAVTSEVSQTPEADTLIVRTVEGVLEGLMGPVINSRLPVEMTDMLVFAGKSYYQNIFTVPLFNGNGFEMRIDINPVGEMRLQFQSFRQELLWSGVFRPTKKEGS